MQIENTLVSLKNRKKKAALPNIFGNTPIAP